MNHHPLRCLRPRHPTVLLALALAGCGDDPPPPAADSVSGVVGAAGGTLSTPGGARVVVPAGAVSRDTTFTIAATTDSPVPTGAATAAGPVYRFGPSGTTFNVPVTVTVPINPDALPARLDPAQDLVIVAAPDGTTDYTPLGQAETSGARASARTTHFTNFASAFGRCGGLCISSRPDTCTCSGYCSGQAFRLVCADGSCRCTRGVGEGRVFPATCSDHAAALAGCGGGAAPDAGAAMDVVAVTDAEAPRDDGGIARDERIVLDLGPVMLADTGTTDAGVRDVPVAFDGGSADAPAAADVPVAADAPVAVDVPVAADVLVVTDAPPPTDGGTSCAVRANGRACRPGDGTCDIAQFTSGSWHTDNLPCLVQTDGWIRCWGEGWAFGALGNGRTELCHEVGLVSNISDARQVVSGTYFGCARRPTAVAGTDRIECWGSNGYGILGLGTTDTVAHPLPTEVPVAAGVLSATTGSVCSLLASGVAWCWGSNSQGELGTGSSNSVGAPTPITATTFQQIDGGRGHLCGVDGVAGATGDVWCWGEGSSGALGHLDPSMARVPTRVAGLTGARSACAANAFSCALMNDGTVRCWGDNSYGQLGRASMVPAYTVTPAPVAGLTGVVELGCGGDGACARRGDGTVWCWGGADALGNGVPAARASAAAVPGLAGVRRLSADGQYCALLGSGDLRCWGGYSGAGNDHVTTPTRVVF